MTYSIVSGNDDRKFSIEGNQKAVVVLRKPLDFERGDSLFNLTILAKVGEHYKYYTLGQIDPSLSVSCLFRIAAFLLYHPRHP